MNLLRFGDNGEGSGEDYINKLIFDKDSYFLCYFGLLLKEHRI